MLEDEVVGFVRVPVGSDFVLLLELALGGLLAVVFGGKLSHWLNFIGLAGGQASQGKRRHRLDGPEG